MLAIWIWPLGLNKVESAIIARWLPFLDYIDEGFFRDLYLESSFTVTERYGLPRPEDDSPLEMVMFSEHEVKTDLFGLRRNASGDGSFTGYYTGGGDNVYHSTYPGLDLSCKVSIDIVGSLIYAPCNPRQCAEAEYGLQWFEPRNSVVSTNLLFLKSNDAVGKREVHYVYGYERKRCDEPSLMWGCDEAPPMSNTWTTEANLGLRNDTTWWNQNGRTRPQDNLSR